ncbi:MAG: hypothetical protein BGP01_03435 [Paludibacter sp. 47-17]|nr:MAG: hypothetical protein BGP01_03435 [Paludibacter sp. 47-17]
MNLCFVNTSLFLFHEAFRFICLKLLQPFKVVVGNMHFFRFKFVKEKQTLGFIDYKVILQSKHFFYLDKYVS